MHRMTMREAISKYWPEEAGAAPTPRNWRLPEVRNAATERYNAWAKANQRGVCGGKGKQCPMANGRACCSKPWRNTNLIQPTILYEFPTDISPLSKQKPDDPSLDRTIRDLRGGNGNRQWLLGIE